MRVIFYIAGILFAVFAGLFVYSLFRKGKAKRTRAFSLAGMTLAAGMMAFAYFGAGRLFGQPLTTTTIGQFSDDIKAIAEQSPDGFVYTESIGSPETFTVTVDDPAIAKEALEIILDASVDRVGWQMDMYQMQYQEYCFFFGEERCTFVFVPYSYFYYGGEYYELGEHRLSRLSNYLHETYDFAEPEEETEPVSAWYGDDAIFQTNFVDNGDEARSVTELTLSVGGETVTGVIEGAYEVLSIDKQPDSYVISYTYGDFYRHDAIRSSRITVENGEMVITDSAP